MSCCGQKRSELKRRSEAAVTAAPDSSPRASQRGRAPFRVRPGDPHTTNAALLEYLTRNGKLFGAR